MSEALPLSGWPLWWRLLLVSSLWATAFPVVRLLTRSMPPFALSFGRGVAAVLVMLGFALATGAFRGLRRGFWRHGALLGTTNGWLPNCLIAVALVSLGAATVSLIQSTTPLFVALLAFGFLPTERPGLRTLAGMAVGFAGIAVILGPQALLGGSGLLAGGLVLLAALSYAVGTVYVRRRQPGSPVALSVGQQAGSAAGAGVMTLLFEPAGAFDQPIEVWGAVLWVGVVASALPLTFFLSLAQRARATDAAMTGYLQPGFAAVFAALLLAEWPEPRVLLGGAVVLLGVWLATGRR
ncbi:DMT family transporter [Pararoseomonas indoligenes]|uniref:DMT family transporter n=1 Tax=Roseomonas indoligenes TaxID=2820811 RepID=A0A940MTZ5_9PROT|nr:DMT family transporter [Pararoseomonas indoligenes]MBP0491648.1 DMT family transporter [Pararoseomonas indoligenes]